WYFLRVSGVAMLVLVLGHVFIMHYLTAPSQTDATFVEQRWTSLFWRGFDWMLLVTALSHGLLGSLTVARDYVHRIPNRRVVGVVVVVVAVAVVALGTTTILTFVSARAVDGPSAPPPFAWLGDILAA